MKSMMKSNPKLIFLFDGFGALLSALVLSIVWFKFQTLFGMPHQALFFLSIIPCLFVVYDFICFFFIVDKWRPFLKIIAIANLIYCAFSVVLLFYHFEMLTKIGISYFLIEFIIIILLVSFEWKMANLFVDEN